MSDAFDTGARVRALYRKACHGAGAEARWEARDALDAIALAGGHTDTVHGRPEPNAYHLLKAHGLDLGAYAAACPISRPGKAP